MNKLIIRGYYLDGQSAKRIEASLQSALNGSLTLVPNDHALLPIHFNQPDISISAPLGNTPREIDLGENRVFTSNDTLAINALEQSISSKKQVFSLAHKLESNLLSVILFSISVIMIVGVIFMYGIPKAAKIIAYELPPQVTENLSTTLHLLDASVFSPSELSEKRKKEIRLLFSPHLLSHKDLNPTLHFRSGMGANALALPNGEIVFTDDLINLAKNDQQLLSVLFHELGHIKHKHLTQRVLQGSMISIAVILLTGDLDGLDIMTGIPTLLVDLAYSREFEREADQYAIQLLKQEGIPVTTFSDLIERLSSHKHPHSHEDSSNFNDYFSSHPNSQDRINIINSNQ